MSRHDALRHDIGHRLRSVDRGIFGAGVPVERRGLANVSRHNTLPFMHVVGKNRNNAARTAEQWVRVFVDEVFVARTVVFRNDLGGQIVGLIVESERRVLTSHQCIVTERS